MVLRVRALSPFPRLIYGVLSLAPSPFLFLHSKVPPFSYRCALCSYIPLSLLRCSLSFTSSPMRARSPSPVQSPRHRSRARKIHRVSPPSASASLAHPPLSVSTSSPGHSPPSILPFT